MINISGFGLQAQITASNTFPNGFSFTEFADDADPLDSPDLDATDTAMALNGDLIVWSRAQGIEITLNAIPTSPGDTNIDVLLNANRVAKGKVGARDIVRIVLTYPSGQTVTMSSGVIVSGKVMPEVASAGRFKTRPYKFRFEQVTKTSPPAA